MAANRHRVLSILSPLVCARSTRASRSQEATQLISKVSGALPPLSSNGESQFAKTYELSASGASLVNST